MHSNQSSNQLSNQSSAQKSKGLVYLLVVLVVTIALFYITNGEDIVTFFIIFGVGLFVTFVAMFCINCCCRRRLHAGAVLSPQVVVTQVVPDTRHGRRHRSRNTNTNVVISQTRPQMPSHMRQTTTPLMSSVTNPHHNGSNGLESMPYSPCVPSAPPIDGQDLSGDQKLPTYEEAIQSKY